MGDEVASSNVNRSYSLAATSIAIFTFMLFFLYPRFKGGEINGWLFQVLLVVMGVATFSFVFASFYYYALLLRCLAWQPDRRCRAGSVLPARRSLLAARLHPPVPGSELDPLHGWAFAVGLIWFALWLVYLLFVIRHFPRVQIPLP